MNFDWQNIDTVLLDMDGTLLDLNYDTSFWLDHLPAIWAQKNNVDLEQGRARFAPIFVEHAGTLNWYCIDFWSRELGLEVMDYKRDLAHKIRYRDTAEAFLARCRKETNDVRLITNAHRKTLDLKNEITQINRYFDQTLCSHELNRPKEDLLFWPALDELQPFDPERTLFIDDNESVLEAAHAYGIKHLYSILEPDSRRPRKTPSKFEMLARLA